ncbi:MAG TPA: hypothetical protein VNQ73_02625 [Ilumatobacter sp.]|nr:hypothetical protein [Ilumatobacter sp.]
MPRRSHPTSPSAPHPAPAPVPVGGGYDWARFGRHRLRAPVAVLVDLPVPVAPDATVWVASIWTDPASGAGWARMVWDRDPERGGWRLPGPLAAGDVLEFGADTPAGPVRWYGIMDGYDYDRDMTVQGPYPDPATAWSEAQRRLAAARYLPPIAAEPAGPRALSRHVPRRRCRRRG